MLIIMLLADRPIATQLRSSIFGSIRKTSQTCKPVNFILYDHCIVNIWCTNKYSTNTMFKRQAYSNMYTVKMNVELNSHIHLTFFEI